jgi:hypothetical protein
MMEITSAAKKYLSCMCRATTIEVWVASLCPYSALLMKTVGANRVAQNDYAQTRLLSYFSGPISSTKSASRISNEIETNFVVYGSPDSRSRTSQA